MVGRCIVLADYWFVAGFIGKGTTKKEGKGGMCVYGLFDPFGSNMHSSKCGWYSTQCCRFLYKSLAPLSINH